MPTPQHPTPHDPEPLAATVTEAAHALGLSTWSVYQLIKSGRLASFRVGRAVRVPVDALHRFASGSQ
ncbi:helix-turn-helix domain-containing protein [Micrococcus luteus]|uniref:helix-turn-helix domain-containing protein n=1 Tax=Micrococcus luteus TaxID=1270 RepID=UPI00382C9E32